MRNLTRGLLPALMLTLLPLAAPASVLVGVSVNIAPPALPVYVQPAIPAPGYIWTPGYWAWGPGDYYWVPGTWVQPPAVGLLWTPGYWGWAGGAYLWHVGYWGPHVGFYGGINYGCGYVGVGYAGGYWHGNQFRYNASVNNVRNINVTNVYTRTVVNTAPVTRASFNGGAGGIVARPSPAELSAEHERHVAYTGAQREHENLAQSNNSLRASVNGGRPPIAATSHAAVFTGRGVVAAHAPSGYVGSNPAHYAGEHAVPGGTAHANAQYSGHAPNTCERAVLRTCAVYREHAVPRTCAEYREPAVLRTCAEYREPAVLRTCAEYREPAVLRTCAYARKRPVLRACTLFGAAWGLSGASVPGCAAGPPRRA